MKSVTTPGKGERLAARLLVAAAIWFVGRKVIRQPVPVLALTLIGTGVHELLDLPVAELLSQLAANIGPAA